MKLIITEKPSVARDIAKVLKVNAKKEGLIEGNGWVITWALGHLIEFIQPDEYGKEYERWEMVHLPIIPDVFKTRPIERSKTQYEIAKAQLREATLVKSYVRQMQGEKESLFFDWCTKLPIAKRR